MCSPGDAPFRRQLAPEPPPADLSVIPPPPSPPPRLPPPQVLGDRSIKYKYLNPNTLIVALGSGPIAPPPGSPSPSSAAAAAAPVRKSTAAVPKSLFSGGDEDEDDAALPSVTLLVLDSATGRVLHSQVRGRGERGGG